MSHRQHKKRSRQKARGNARSSTTIKSSRSLQDMHRRQLLLAATDLALTLLVVAAGLLLKWNPLFARRIAERTPTPVFIAAAGGLVSATVITFIRIILRVNRRFFVDPEYAIGYLRVSIALDGVRVALFAALLLYGSGVIDAFANALSTFFTFLSVHTSYIVSTVIGWLASGIIGNASYDLLRRILTPRRK